MKLLLNHIFVAVFVLFGTMSLQAQQTDTPQPQQEDQEISELIDRLDGLMARALQLDESGFDDARREGVGVDREREDIEQDQDQEGVGVQRDRDAIGQAGDEKRKKKEKMVKRFGEDLGLAIGNMKKAAESYQELLQEEGQETPAGISGADVQQENDAQQQDDAQQQQERADAEEDEQMRQDLEQVREHLLAMADEMEKAVEAVEKLNGSQRPGQTEFESEEYK